MNFKFCKNSRGQATFLIVTVLCIVGTVILMSSLDVFVRDYSHKAKDFNQVLLDETTSSAFAVMETALERRMWEPPPDASCMRTENMEVKGSTPDDVNWKVTAHFNFATKNFEMISTGEYKELTSTFKKKIKVMDVSDYLLLSTNPNSVVLARLYSNKAPSALIARDRRIYTRGPLVMGSAIARLNFKTDFNGTPGEWPDDWGTILQGDRMQFAGGIQYRTYIVPKPNPDSTSNIESLLAPFSNAYGAAPTHVSQWGGGASVFTKDYDKAIRLQNMVRSGATGPLSKASVAAEVYPIALFNGTPPLKAWTAVDNGSYFNNVDRQSIFYYNYALANEYGVRLDATCFGLANTEKICSHSEHFPKGFEAWRTNAGLDGYLFTTDAVEVPSPTIGWDNLQALEEDALACGAVISTPVNPYTDCPVWDSNFITKYANGGDVSGCQSISNIDLNAVTLNGLDITAVNDPANTGRLLRRVLYLKGPATIKQSDPAGLMLATVPSNVARKNLSLWVVSEDMITLQGYQANKTSPLVTQPSIMREIIFNGDTAVPAVKEPLNLILLTTEKVHLISEQYHPMTPVHLKTIWPVVGGKIRPIRHNLTDWERQEDDGFKYGYRRYTINGVSLISNGTANAGEPFYLQGLWSGPNSTAFQFPSNECMISLAGNPLSKNSEDSPLMLSAAIPAYHAVANSPIPPPSSLFYNGENKFPRSYVPAIFWAQRTAFGEVGREQSEIILNGISMMTSFSNEAPTGSRLLNTPLYKTMEGPTLNMPFDLSSKHFVWDSDSYYETKDPSVSCIPSNVQFRQIISSPYDPIAVQPSTNNGRQVFVQSAPKIDYRNVGSVVGIDQLVIETKADPSAPTP
jgi:hypothetical protein